MKDINEMAELELRDYLDNLYNLQEVVPDDQQGNLQEQITDCEYAMTHNYPKLI